MDTEKDVVYVTENTKIYLVEDLIRGVGSESSEDVRCSGRTTRTAFKLINLALNNPGKRITIKDHVESYSSTYLCRMLQNILKGFPFFQIEAHPNPSDGSFVYYLLCTPLTKKGNNHVSRQKNTPY